ncbi:MAG: methylaspartate mutase accessory protein GlmL [Peptococcaceae bacterium]
MGPVLAIDFGSTNTKITAIDLVKEEIIATAKSHTTIETNIMDGLHKALTYLKDTCPLIPDSVKSIACSSAAGGLKMITIGLVPDLTAQASQKAALGAGAKVIKTYANILNKLELQEIEKLAPDIILLCGGTDGGNSKVICSNAQILASAQTTAPIIVAGNKNAYDEIEVIFQNSHKDVRITENIMPEIGVLNYKKVQEEIRKVFIEKIIAAKGLKKAENFVEGILMPTPTAVLKAVGLLATGTKSEKGIGDIMVIDIGGATTDVYTAAKGDPTQPGVIVKGLAEQFLKRTVEGDIGMRYSAGGIAAELGIAKLATECKRPPGNIITYLEKILNDVTYLAQPAEYEIEMALARGAVQISTERHSGFLKSFFTSHGEVLVQRGKDLTQIPIIIGTGGVIANSKNPAAILEKALYDNAHPLYLKPKQANIYVDKNYVLYAIGLLAELNPDKALRIAQKTLKKIN